MARLVIVDIVKIIPVGRQVYSTLAKATSQLYLVNMLAIKACGAIA